MVVAKPAGILAQSDETGDRDLLTLGKAWLKKKFKKPGNVFLGLIHRLDRPASGIMIFGRNSKAAARLTDQFKARTVDKRYMAIVEGTLAGEGHWTDYMMKNGRTPTIVSKNNTKGKLAELQWRALSSAGGLTLVEVKLLTGRPHQIRLQFASRGFPLLGDLRYEAKRVFDGQNLALHAYHLSLVHPTLKEQKSWKLPPPEAWRPFFPQEIKQLLAGS